MNYLIKKIITHHKALLAVVFVLSIPFAYFYAHQQFFNHIDIYFEKSDPDLVAYKAFQKKYGNEEIAVIAFKAGDIFTLDNITLIRRLSDMARKHSGVQRVFSITEAEEARGTEETISFQKIVPRQGLSVNDMPALKKRILSDHLLAGNLISTDGHAAAVVVELESFEDNRAKGAVIRDLEEQARAIAGKDIKLHFAGTPFVEVELNRLSVRDTLLFTPIVLILIFIIVSLLLRRVILSAFAMINLVLVAVWAMGFFTLTGERMNMVTVIIPPVLLAISIADGIHLLSHFRELHVQSGLTYPAAVKEAVRSVWLPCLFTSLTTAIGFFSFVTSPIRPVKIVGIYTFVGVMIAFFMTMIALPALLIFFRKRLDTESGTDGFDETPGETQPGGHFVRVLDALGSITTGRYRSIAAVFFVIIAVAFIGMSMIRFETNFGNYLPDKSRLRQDADFITNNMGGIIPIEFLVRARSKGDDFTHTKSLELLEDIPRELKRDVPTFTSSYSIVDYIKEMNRAFNEGREDHYRIPERREDIVFYTESGDPEILDRIISLSRNEARISFRSLWISNENAKKASLIIKNYLRKKLKGSFTYVRTGLATLYVKMGDNLKESQVRSFLIAFLIIFAMMFFVCRNILLTFISIVPNLLPIFMTLGIMGLMDIPLDVATVMIASVTLGIAVDDTIHLITWFRRNVQSGIRIPGALRKTFLDVGKPVVITSVVLFAGFFVLVLGEMKPTRSFGILTAFSMLFALAGDLFLLPALIMLFRKWIKIR